MTEAIDTPLTRQKRKYEAQLEEKDQEIAELKIQMATVRGVNDLLKFELAGLEKSIVGMQKTLDEAKEHIRILKFNLPDIQK